jgi:hypothetical protein
MMRRETYLGLFSAGNIVYSSVATGVDFYIDMPGLHFAELLKFFRIFAQYAIRGCQSYLLEPDVGN